MAWNQWYKVRSSLSAGRRKAQLASCLSGSFLVRGLEHPCRRSIFTRFLITTSCSIGSNFCAVSTNPHAAPAPRSYLACVMEMQDAMFTLANSLVIQGGKELGCRLSYRGY